MACVVATKYVDDFSRICWLAEIVFDPDSAVDQSTAPLSVRPSFVCMAEKK